MKFILVLLVLTTLPLHSQSFTLPDLTSQALANGPMVRAQQLETQLARVGVQQARSRFMPTISGQVSGTLLANPPEGVTLAQGSLGSVPAPGSTFPSPVPDTDLIVVPDPLNSFFQAKINLNQPIYTWGKLRDGLAASQIQLSIYLLEQNKTQNHIIRDVRQAHSGFLMAQEAAGILDQALGLYREIEQDRRRSFEQGAINREDLLSVQRQLVEIESQALEARYSVRTALEGLRVLTGIPALEASHIAGTLPQPREPKQTTDELIALARQNNTDLTILQQRIEQARIGQSIQERTNTWRPDIALSVEMDVSGQRFPGIPNWIDYWDWGFNITLGTRFSLYDGGAQSGKIQESALQVQQVLQGYEAYRSSLGLQIAQLHERQFRSYRRYLNGQASRDLILEQEKNARVSFENDLITREQLLGAQLLVITNQLELLSAAFEAENAWSELTYLLSKDLE